MIVIMITIMIVIIDICVGEQGGSIGSRRCPSRLPHIRFLRPAAKSVPGTSANDSSSGSTCLGFDLYSRGYAQSPY